MKQLRDRALNDKQFELLYLVYKCRFATRDIIGNSLGINTGSSLHERLEVLVTHEYLGKRKDKRSTALNKPTVYYVAPKGIKALRTFPGYEHIGEQALRLSYQNKNTVSDEYVAQVLNICDLTMHLQRQYPGLKAFTPRETIKYTYFPEKLPERFLSLPSDNIEQPHRFFLDIVPDRQSRRVLEGRLLHYSEFFDSGGWDETDSPLPVILIVVEWGPSERSIQRFVRRVIEKADIGLKIYTSTAKAIQSTYDNLAIWNDAQDADDSVSLMDITINP